MDDTKPATQTGQPLQPIDLSALEGIQLGPNWTQTEAKTNRYKDYDEPRRGDRRSDSRSGGMAPRDRRPAAFRPDGRAGADRPSPEGRDPRGPQSERFRPRHGPRGEGGVGRDSGIGGESGWGNRGSGRPFRGGPRQEEVFRPVVEVQFFPEDGAFKALTTAIRNSCRTFELFEIARLILQKPERFVVVVRHFPGVESDARHLFLSVPDGLPFLSEEEALQHVLSQHLEAFCTTEEIEVEAPKGSFPMISRCTLTGALLGPPNYHRYQELLRQHHATHLAHLSFERFLSRIESVRDPEVAQQWLAQMTRQTRYTLKIATEASAGGPASFESLESLRFHLQTHHRELLVRSAENVRFEGKLLDKMPSGVIRRSVEATLEQQRRFPLDTANHLRGRLRRLYFTVYKKGSKGISLICAVKRKYRTPDTNFTEAVQRLIAHIEAHPDCRAADLPAGYLGFEIPAPPPQRVSEEPAAPVEADEKAAEPSTQESPEPAAGDRRADPAVPPTPLTPTQQASVAALARDLRWLVSEGYVVEYSDGRLYAPPVQTQPHPPETDSPEPDGTEAGGEAPSEPEPVSGGEAPSEPGPQPDGGGGGEEGGQAAGPEQPLSEGDGPPAAAEEGVPPDAPTEETPDPAAEEAPADPEAKRHD